MDRIAREFYDRLETVISDIDEILEDYEMLEHFDCEEDISDARETLSEVLYRISRM